MKLQGKKTGAFAGFIGWTSPSNPTVIDLPSGEPMLTVRYKDAGTNCYKDYKTIAGFSADWEDYTPEPDPSYLIAKIQKLENSVKALDERLKTVEENTERPHREDNEKILGKVKRYKPEIPPCEKLERMKEQLRGWIEKKPKIEHIEVNFVVDEKANDGRLGIQFLDADDNRDIEDFDIIIWDWPRVGLVDGEIYTPDELLITGEAGKE